MERQDPAAMDEEMGDLLFAAVNVIRLLGRDPEAMLHKATDKFMTRFPPWKPWSWRMERRFPT